VTARRERVTLPSGGGDMRGGGCPGNRIAFSTKPNYVPARQLSAGQRLRLDSPELGGRGLAELHAELGFYPVDPGANRRQRVGPGAQLGRGVGVLVQAGEFLRGFFGAAEHHLR
jgi:hypothetical protein